MTGIRIGDLRERVVIEAAARTADGGGGASEAWVAVAEVWAAVVPASGGERVEADQAMGRVTHTVVVRAGPEVRPAMRIRLDARLFEIKAVTDIGARGRFLRIMAEEKDL